MVVIVYLFQQQQTKQQNVLQSQVTIRANALATCSTNKIIIIERYVSEMK